MPVIVTYVKILYAVKSRKLKTNLLIWTSFEVEYGNIDIFSVICVFIGIVEKLEIDIINVI